MPEYRLIVMSPQGNAINTLDMVLAENGESAMLQMYGDLMAMSLRTTVPDEYHLALDVKQIGETHSEWLLAEKITRKNRDWYE